jgi:hypothetical protein
MRSLLAVALSVLLGLQALATPPNPELVSSAKKIKPGTQVTVKLLNSEKVKGTLVSVTDSAVDVVGVKDKEEFRRTITYDQMKSIEKQTSTWAWVTLGGVAAVVVLLVVGAAYAKS